MATSFPSTVSLAANSGKTAGISLLKYGFRSTGYPFTIAGQTTSMLYTSRVEAPVRRISRSIASRCCGVS